MNHDILNFTKVFEVNSITSLVGKRIKYIPMKGGWGYGTILNVKEDGDLVAHLDCQEKDEEWIISKCAFGKWYFLCDKWDEQT